jgi:methyl-accepting chemotaxis protein
MQVFEVSYGLFLVFTIAVVIGVVVQATVFILLVLAIRRAVEKIEKATTDLSGKAVPLMFQTRVILEDLSPKVKTITSNLVEISNTLKNQTQHVNSTVGEVVDKTRQQADRVDEMVTAVLDSVTHAGATIQAGVSKPVRQVSGILNGIRVGIETFLRKSQPARGHANGTAADESHAHGVHTPNF